MVGLGAKVLVGLEAEVMVGLVVVDSVVVVVE